MKPKNSQLCMTITFTNPGMPIVVKGVVVKKNSKVFPTELYFLAFSTQYTDLPCTYLMGIKPNNPT